MAGAHPRRGVVKRVAPPLQADLAEPGLGHLLGNAGKLGIEGIEREQPVARVRRQRTSADR